VFVSGHGRKRAVPELFSCGLNRKSSNVSQIDAAWRGESWSASKRNDADLTRRILYYGTHRNVVSEA